MDLKQKIDDAYDAEPPERARQYIGASGAGTTCSAEMAFSLRGFPGTKIDPGLKRIFKFGHMLEDFVVADIKKTGVEIREVDPSTGRQWEYSALGGHVSCHMDGLIEFGDGVERILEIKSMNKANFSKFKSKGVAVSHPKYYAQLQMMMYMSGFRESCFIAICKDNCEYHFQLVKYDSLEMLVIRGRVGDALQNKARKISSDETFWKCRGCFKRDACFGGAVGDKSCAKCHHAIASDDGDWHCLKHDRKATALCGDFEVYTPLPKGKGK